ncbi:MAG: hypothetical protein LBD04_10660 [Synergistaceae bacterium]|jgi:hypothetical protein|nr:hypothetical protein [Synergistaceae bacterium]
MTKEAVTDGVIKRSGKRKDGAKRKDGEDDEDGARKSGGARRKGADGAATVTLELGPLGWFFPCSL